MFETENENSKVNWKGIDWKKVEYKVFKLQKRIYRASKVGDTELVRKLQKLLTRSWYAKLIAVRRISQENKGKKTAGVDGIKNLSPNKRLELAKNLKLDGKSRAAKRVWIPKPGKKEKRPLGIATMLDRAKQALLKMAIEPEWEAKFENNSYGFRPGRTCHDAVKAIWGALNQRPKYIYDADLSKCFDQINHKYLLKKLNTLSIYKKQIRAWLKSGVIDTSEWADKKGYQATEKRTPQGGVISPLLANIALHGMEEAIIKAYPRTKDGKNLLNSISLYGKRGVSSPKLIRYADDFVIIHEDIKILKGCIKVIEKWLKPVGLKINESKTKIKHSLEEYEGQKPGINFLGFNIRHYKVGKHHSGKNSQGKLINCKLLVKPSDEAVQKHLENLSNTIRKVRAGKQAELIQKLNKIVRGWRNYQSPWNSKETLHKVDHILWKKLWRWAKRRHPNKGKNWVKTKYFKWNFSTLGEEDYELLRHDGVSTEGYWVKVKEDKSPYNGDELYWSQRLGENYKTIDSQKARLLKVQKGKCSHCGLVFKSMDNIEKHHIIPKANKGKGTDKNLTLLHQHCHDLIHSEEGTSKGTSHNSRSAVRGNSHAAF